MSFLKFAFSFLYVRDWNTGKMELSRPRVALFAAGIFLLLLALAIISILEASVEYIAP